MQQFYGIACDCVVGRYVTFVPGALCSGVVELGDYCYVGVGAVIKQGTLGRPRSIVNRSVVGMGAVVAQDVLNDVIVSGNLAKVFRRFKKD